jgi:hypothetical protein
MHNEGVGGNGSRAGVFKERKTIRDGTRRVNKVPGSILWEVCSWKISMEYTGCRWLLKALSQSEG